MPSDGSTEATLVTVARFDWLPEADLARCRLDACEIESHILEEFFGSIYWHYAKALGGFRLQVSSDDVEDALAVLHEPPVDGGGQIVDEAEALAERFARAAVFGWLALPLGFYSLWLLYRVFCIPRAVDGASTPGRRQGRGDSGTAVRSAAGGGGRDLAREAVRVPVNSPPLTETRRVRLR